MQKYGVLVDFDLASGPAFRAWQPERIFILLVSHLRSTPKTNSVLLAYLCKINSIG